MELDYLIVGSGLFGSVFAYEAAKRGKKVKVIEKREHLGGNVYTEKEGNINVHKYGAHIFHTNDKKIWDYVNSFVEFDLFINSPIAISNNQVYNLPFNMNTFSKIYNVVTPEEAKHCIEKSISLHGVESPSNLEEQAIKLVGREVYDLLIKEYSEKQWGRSAKELPAFIIKRLPVRFSYDNNYFNDRFQGIPKNGYTELIDKLLKGIEADTKVDFFSNRDELLNSAKKIIYTGKIDEFYDYCYGHLNYRSLTFVEEKLPIENYQGNAVVNYCDMSESYTRILEHKHFNKVSEAFTVITKEYPKEYKTTGDEPYYPINDDRNNNIYRMYQKLSKGQRKVIFGGRLATYKYYDMHQVIASALKTVKDEFED